MKKGSATSIRAILKNIADSEGIDFQMLVIRYMHERLLFRVANSEYSNNFVLKGGLLLYAIKGLHTRPTKDIDVHAKRLSNDKENIKAIFSEICNVKYDDDCVRFDASTIVTSDIAEEMKYKGVRLLIKTQFDTIKQTLQVDIGFGDVIVPEPVLIKFPTLLDGLKSPNILAYTIETVIAEKFSAMITRGVFNSRMKDFYDVYILLKNRTIAKESLHEAVLQTFMHRATPFVENHPLFSETFREDKNRQTMWKAFLRKTKISENLEFSLVVKSIIETLQPIYNQIYNK